MSRKEKVFLAFMPLGGVGLGVAFGMIVAHGYSPVPLLVVLALAWAAYIILGTDSR